MYNPPFLGSLPRPQPSVRGRRMRVHSLHFTERNGKLQEGLSTRFSALRERKRRFCAPQTDHLSAFHGFLWKMALAFPYICPQCAYNRLRDFAQGREKISPLLRRFFILVLDKKLSKLLIAPQARQELMRDGFCGRLPQKGDADSGAFLIKIKDFYQEGVSKSNRKTDVFPALPPYFRRFCLFFLLPALRPAEKRAGAFTPARRRAVFPVCRAPSPGRAPPRSRRRQPGSPSAPWSRGPGGTVPRPPACPAAP